MSINDIEEIFGDYVLIKLHEQDKVSKGGIIIPDSVNASPKSMATVIKCGKGFTDQNTGEFTPITVSVGDAVSLNNYLCNEISELIFDNEKYYIIREIDLDCIMEQHVLNEPIMSRAETYDNLVNMFAQ